MEWQPIVSAPKDGTEFLCYAHDRGTPHRIVGRFGRNGAFIARPGTMTTWKPTYWMPLPDPPLAQPRSPQDEAERTWRPQ